MSKTKINFGIDLGTTNSAIASMDNGKVKIIKSDRFQKDTTPSCVSYKKKGRMDVGDQSIEILNDARNQKNQDPNREVDDAYAEFKRDMGTDHKYQSNRLGRSLPPEELSAEVLKKLKSYAQGDGDKVNAAVITVPAFFEQFQIDATSKAAELAGFSCHHLLQEPIAASIAYGIEAKEMDGKWIVFDFGGGTFDAALMQVAEGIMQVLATEGDNRLGGSDLDYAIVDDILIPWLSEKYEMEFRVGDDQRLSYLRDDLKQHAEKIKIELSIDGKDSCDYYEDNTFTDDAGEEVEFELTISLEEYEKVIGPIFQRAIDIAKELIKRKGLKDAELERILLVGGPTLSQTFRRMLREQFDTEIDVSIDPMTAVAVGATLSASTKDLPDELRVKDLAKAQLQLKYPATTVEIEAPVTVKVLRKETEGDVPEDLEVEILTQAGNWSSGRMKLEEAGELIMVSLKEGEANVFQLSLFDEKGNSVACEPSEFSILQGFKPPEATLPFAMGIQIRDTKRDRDVFSFLEGLSKEQPLPTKGRGNYRTQTDLRDGDYDDKLHIAIFQGEHGDEGTRTAYLNKSTDIFVTSDQMPGFVPAGSEFELTIKVDASRKISGEIFFPSLDESVEIKFPESRKKTLDKEELEQEIQKVKASLVMDENAGFAIDPAAEERINGEIYRIQGGLEKAGDNKGARDVAQKQIRGLFKEIDKLQDKAAWPKVDKELEEAMAWLRNKADGFGSEETETQVDEFEQKCNQVRSQENAAAGERLIQEIYRFGHKLQENEPGYWAALIMAEDANFATSQWSNETEARMAIDEGLRTIRTNPTLDNLRSKCYAIWRLRKDSSKGPSGGGGSEKVPVKD